MTTHLTTKQRIAALLAFAGLSAFSPATLDAQERVRPSEPTISTRSIPAPGVEEEVAEVEDDELCIVSLDFPGGKLSDFLAMLRQVLRTTESRRFHNLLATGPTTRISIPEITVHRVEISSLFEAVARMMPPHHVLDFNSIHNGDGNPVMMVSAYQESADEDESGFASKVAIEAFPLRSLTTVLPTEPMEFALSTKTVLTAIETALELTPGEAEPATLRFHEDSGLLLVQGTMRQIETIRMILAAMTEDIERLRARHRLSRKEALEDRAPPRFDDVTMPPNTTDKPKNSGR